MKIDFADVLMILGMGAVVLGFYLIAPEMALIAGGLICFGAGLVRGMRRAE